MSTTPQPPDARDPRGPSSDARGLSPAPPQHPGPGEAWRPLSGLCLSAFILALALALLSLTTLWAGLLLPLALGLVALATVDAARYRGRALAWAAVVVSLVFGGVMYTYTNAMSRSARSLVDGFLAALRSERATGERVAGLKAWLVPGSTQDATLERVDARWRQALERLGPLQGGAILPSVWAGQFPLLVPPTGVVAVDDPQNPGNVPAPGSVLWARLPFERGEAHVALALADGSAEGTARAMTEVEQRTPAAVVRDVRFFAAPGLLEGPAQAPTPPTER